MEQERVVAFLLLTVTCYVSSTREHIVGAKVITGTI